MVTDVAVGEGVETIGGKLPIINVNSMSAVYLQRGGAT